jgi:hypothetical protein
MRRSGIPLTWKVSLISQHTATPTACHQENSENSEQAVGMPIYGILYDSDGQSFRFFTFDGSDKPLAYKFSCGVFRLP